MSALIHFFKRWGVLVAGGLFMTAGGVLTPLAAQSTAWTNVSLLTMMLGVAAAAVGSFGAYMPPRGRAQEALMEEALCGHLPLDIEAGTAPDQKPPHTTSSS